MKKNRTSTSTSIRKYMIRPAERIEILWKAVSKGKDSWDYYDIKYGDVIITGCRMVETKSGTFLGMPSKEQDGNWYPICYLSHSLGDKLAEYISDADDNDDWEEVDSDAYLWFDSGSEAEGKTGKATKNKKD